MDSPIWTFGECSSFVQKSKVFRLNQGQVVTLKRSRDKLTQGAQVMWERQFFWQRKKWRVGKKRKTKSPLFRPAHKTCQETNCWKNGSKVNRKSGPMAHNNDFPVVKAASLQLPPYSPKFLPSQFSSPSISLEASGSLSRADKWRLVNYFEQLFHSSSFNRLLRCSSPVAAGDILQNLLICDISLIRGKGRGWTEVKGGISSITILLIYKFLKRVRNLLSHHELYINTRRSKVCGFWKENIGI